MKTVQNREWLIEARQKKNLTQMEVGKLVGVSGNAITQYEKGKRFPKPLIMQKLCEILEIDVSLFYQN